MIFFIYKHLVSSFTYLMIIYQLALIIIMLVSECVCLMCGRENGIIKKWICKIWGSEGGEDIGCGRFLTKQNEDIFWAS
jgi:hypothetical protein